MKISTGLSVSEHHQRIRHTRQPDLVPSTGCFIPMVNLLLTGIITMGQIVYAGNLAVSASTSSRKKYYWETYNLVGDPSVIPIIGTPDTFSTLLPDTLPNGIKSWSFIADPFSYIAVSHSDTLWDASFVSPSGSVTLEMPGLIR